jgi:hypothetical protein
MNDPLEIPGVETQPGLAHVIHIVPAGEHPYRTTLTALIGI